MLQSTTEGRWNGCKRELIGSKSAQLTAGCYIPNSRVEALQEKVLRGLFFFRILGRISIIEVCRIRLYRYGLEKDLTVWLLLYFVQLTAWYTSKSSQNVDTIHSLISLVNYAQVTMSPILRTPSRGAPYIHFEASFLPTIST